MTGYRFAGGGKLYTFPPEIHILADNFADGTLNPARMPGVDGGFDSLGDTRSPAEIGSVQMEFSIGAAWAQATYAESDPALALQKARDAVRAMAQWGKKRLYKPIGSSERWCWAKVNSIHMPLALPTLQRVTLQFQVAQPYWFAQGTEAPEWGEVEWGLFQWGGTATPQACSGTSTTWTVTTTGNAQTHPRLTLIAKTGGVLNPILQRIVEGSVVDEVRYTGAMVNTDQLEINCRAHTVKFNTSNGYTSAFDYERPGWITLEPGANTLRLLMGDAGNSCDVYVRYYEAYRS